MESGSLDRWVRAGFSEEVTFKLRCEGVKEPVRWRDGRQGAFWAESTQKFKGWKEFDIFRELRGSYYGWVSAGKGGEWDEVWAGLKGFPKIQVRPALQMWPYLETGSLPK